MHYSATSQNKNEMSFFQQIRASGSEKRRFREKRFAERLKKSEYPVRDSTPRFLDLERGVE